MGAVVDVDLWHEVVKWQPFLLVCLDDHWGSARATQQMLLVAGSSVSSFLSRVENRVPSEVVKVPRPKAKLWTRCTSSMLSLRRRAGS